jgi:hypothetical protein
MVRLRGVKLTPDETRAILKYLAIDHGLAGEQAKPIMYYAEHRIENLHVTLYPQADEAFRLGLHGRRRCPII